MTETLAAREQAAEASGGVRAADHGRTEATAPAGPAARAHRSRPGEDAVCPIARAAALLADPWTMMLLRDLQHGPRRFTELEASTGISPRVLTDRLRTLCEQGVLTRHLYPEIPPRVVYELTEKGQAAQPVLEALYQFGQQWLAEPSPPGPLSHEGRGGAPEPSP